MKALLASLFSGDESEVDSVIVCGVVALLALIGCTVAALIMAPVAFSPVGTATGMGTVIGAIAGGKTARDRWSQGGPKP